MKCAWNGSRRRRVDNGRVRVVKEERKNGGVWMYMQLWRGRKGGYAGVGVGCVERRREGAGGREKEREKEAEE